MEDYAIELKNVSKTYGGRRESKVTALSGIDLRIRKGEFVAICGVSGSGKSTLLNLIGCLDKASSGDVFLNGRSVNKLSSRSRAHIRNSETGFVLQDFGLIPYRTAYENVMLPFYFSSKRVKDRSSRVCMALNSTGVSELRSRKVSKLSGGEKQRVAIARALVNDPDIILADEPTGALDSKTKKEIIRLFEEINEQGKTVVVVTHDMELANAAHRVLHIKDGHIE